jgi:hypothetical protein
MRTEVRGEGHLVNGTIWQGSLILRGYGDPTLDRSRPLSALAVQGRTGRQAPSPSSERP